MSSGELLSVLINLVVGIYFAVFYPHGVRRKFASRPMPRGLVLLLKVVPPTGYAVIAMTLFYVGAVVTNLMPRSGY